MAGQIIVQGQLTGIPAGYVNIGPYIITPNGSNNFSIQEITLASGNNTISVPTWASGVIINPSTANTVLFTLKGANADTGIPLGIISPSVINFDIPPATFVLNAASLFTTITALIFF